MSKWQATADAEGGFQHLTVCEQRELPTTHFALESGRKTLKVFSNEGHFLPTTPHRVDSRGDADNIPIGGLKL